LIQLDVCFYGGFEFLSTKGKSTSVNEINSTLLSHQGILEKYSFEKLNWSVNKEPLSFPGPLEVKQKPPECVLVNPAKPVNNPVRFLNC